jgi:hypothetical protein
MLEFQNFHIFLQELGAQVQDGHPRVLGLHRRLRRLLHRRGPGDKSFKTFFSRRL